MKSYISKTLCIIAFTASFLGCKKDETLRDTQVTAVQTLYEPAENKSVVLQNSSSASVYFEWEAAKAEDSGMVLYEVAFYKEGDLTTPIYKMASDNNGGYNYATISHKTLNKIAGYAGIAMGGTGKLVWTVISSKGINEKPAALTRILEITRLVGFDEIPTDVYLTGEGSEGGSDLANAMVMKSVATGEFEIYTKLTAGKTYHFVDGKTGTPRSFYIENNVIKEGSTTLTPAKTAVYRIELDFNVAASSYTEITDMQLYFCPTDAFLFSLDYIGNGVWKASSQPITFKQEDWGRDERYKFKMSTTTADGTDVAEWWGTPNIDYRPSADSPASYYYLFPASNDQWSDKFKFAGEMDNALVDVSVLLQASGPYTHSVVKVGNQ